MKSCQECIYSYVGDEPFCELKCRKKKRRVLELEAEKCEDFKKKLSKSKK